jgi:hypothetical protein
MAQKVVCSFVELTLAAVAHLHAEMHPRRHPFRRTSISLDVICGSKQTLVVLEVAGQLMPKMLCVL